MKCIRIATKADRDGIGRLRQAAFLASPDFHMPDDDWAKSHLPWSAEDAARAVKAINHLIQINGGKKSLF